MNTPLDRPRQTIIILGASGSGKSLISSILTKLPKSVALDENYLPPYLAHLKGFFGDHEDHWKLSAGLRSHINNVLRYGQNGRLALTIQCIQGKIGVVEWLGSLNKTTRTIETVILESHFFSLVPHVLFDAYPDAKFILMVRDGRDVADWLEREFHALSDEDLSRSDSSEFFFTREFNGKTVPWWVNKSEEMLFHSLSPFQRCFYYWTIVTERLLAFQASKLDERVMTLKYECLVNDSMKARDLLINFLGISGDALSPRLFNKLSSTKIGQAKRSRTATDLGLTEKIGKKILSALGYF